jgi:hypothetical protein
MRIRRLPIIALIGFLGAGLSVACSGKRVAAIDDSGAEIPTDPTGSDIEDPTTPSSTPPSTTPEADDASIDIDAAGLFDGGLNFPLDAGPDGSASFCRRYEDFTRGKGQGEVTVQLEGPNGKPRPPTPQCFHIRKGTAVRFEGDVVNNPVVLLGSDGGTGVVPPDPGSKVRSTVVFSEAGSFYFATKLNPNIERGHIIVDP